MHLLSLSSYKPSSRQTGSHKTPPQKNNVKTKGRPAVEDKKKSISLPDQTNAETAVSSRGVEEMHIDDLMAACTTIG